MKNFKVRAVTSSLTLLIFLLFNASVFAVQKSNTGNLTGFIFGPDKTTPVQGAIIKAKNIEDSTVYSSNPSDSRGSFRIEGMKKGIYIIGIATSQGEYNTNNLIGIEENQTTKASFALDRYPDKEVAAIKEVYGPEIIDGQEVRIGKVVQYFPESNEAAVFIEKGLLQIDDRIHVRGYKTDFYQNVKKLILEGDAVGKAFAGQTPRLGVVRPVMVGDFVYITCKRRGLAAFFLSPCGIASVIAGTAAMILGAVALVCEEEETPCKNKK